MSGANYLVGIDRDPSDCGCAVRSRRATLALALVVSTVVGRSSPASAATEITVTPDDDLAAIGPKQIIELGGRTAEFEPQLLAGRVCLPDRAHAAAKTFPEAGLRIGLFLLVCPRRRMGVSGSCR